jgi:hypothetical protein
VTRPPLSDLPLSEMTDEELSAEAASGREESQMVAAEVARRITISKDTIRDSAVVLAILAAVLIYESGRNVLGWW